MLLRVPQMIPNWASSCNSRWLNASQGQITVISARKGRRIYKSASPPGEPFLLKKTSFRQKIPPPLSYSLSRWLGSYLKWPWDPEDQTNCLINPLRAPMAPEHTPPDIFVGSILHLLLGRWPKAFHWGYPIGVHLIDHPGPPQSTTTKEGPEVEF